MWTAIQGDKGLSLDLKFDRQDRAGFLAVNLAADLSIPADARDRRILEYRGVKFRRFLGLGVKPQERSDLLLNFGMIARFLKIAANNQSVPDPPY